MIDQGFTCDYRRIECRIDDRKARSKAAVAKPGGHFQGISRRTHYLERPCPWYGALLDSRRELAK